jgi:hypothetical protein
MSIPITSWLRAFFALKQCAMDSRGFVEIPIDDDEFIRWPRTTGSDVVAVAALFDPSIRAQPLRFGGHGLARQWRACADDLERYALVAPSREYPENQSFWHTLEPVCVYLHAQRAALPPAEIWDALLAQLAEPTELRNVGPKGDGPFQHFENVKTFDDMFIAQFKYLRGLRGDDKMKPDAGAKGPEKIIPRTTNNDVVLLSDYWSKQLRAVKRIPERDGIDAGWRALRADLELARKADPNAVYPKNNAFWRTLQRTAIHIAVADEAPSTTDLAIAAIKESLGSLPDSIKDSAKALGSGASNVVGEIAHGVGKVANEAGKGLFSGFGTPLLIGASLVGAFLLARNRGENKVA